jgi:hypothetical protein
MCSDAFMYIWTKRQFVQDMLRLVDNADAGREGAAVISHTHNQCTWTPSHGQPLTPDGYRNLFETIEPHVFGESSLFADVVAGGPLDLSRRADTKTLEADQALTIVATRHPGVFVPHALETPPRRATGEFRVNPLYTVSDSSSASVVFRLRFPSEDYEQEYGACRQYLPDEVAVSREALAALAAGRVPDGLAGLDDLLRRRVIVDLPRRYGAPSAGIT